MMAKNLGRTPLQGRGPLRIGPQKSRGRPPVRRREHDVLPRPHEVVGPDQDDARRVGNLLPNPFVEAVDEGPRHVVMGRDGPDDEGRLPAPEGRGGRERQEQKQEQGQTREAAGHGALPEQPIQPAD